MAITVLSYVNQVYLQLNWKDPDSETDNVNHRNYRVTGKGHTNRRSSVGRLKQRQTMGERQRKEE